MRTGMPAIHAGMTNSAFSFPMGESKIMEHFAAYVLVADLSSGLPLDSNALFNFAYSHCEAITPIEIISRAVS